MVKVDNKSIFIEIQNYYFFRGQYELTENINFSSLLKQKSVHCSNYLFLYLLKIHSYGITVESKV
jgi:hypothetical protein